MVSVLVPIYNVEKFLPQCLASLQAQTLKEAEFICINDGSKDNSPAIIKDFMKRDKRFKLLDKENSGYGDSMNNGLAMATGKYVGIVESDDWAEPTMFSDLVELAEKNQADAVKSNFYFYSGKNGGSNKKFSVINLNEVGAVITPRESPYIFRGMSTIWSGLYRRQFLLDKKIDFVPSPGASYQDTGFNFKVWAAADRVVYTNNAYLHYRIDNDNSSVKSHAKVFCVCDEFDSIKKYLVDNDLMDQLKATYTQRKWDIYKWNNTRLEKASSDEFINRVAQEFKDDKKNGYLDFAECTDRERAEIEFIMANGAAYNDLRQIRSRLGRVYRGASKLNRAKVKRNLMQSILDETFATNRDTIFQLEEKQLPDRFQYLDNQPSDKPVVSVIVPVYNAAKYLKKTLDSLKNQTLKNIEIVCVDDGSKDESLKILQKYAKADKRFKVVHQANAGVATARNTGLKKASGKYIMWCDSDDTYQPDMCLHMISIMERRSVDMAICSQNISYDHVDNSLVKDTSRYLEHIYIGSQMIDWNIMVTTDVSLWNKIFRADIIKRYNIGFPDGLLFEDAYFCNLYMLNAQTIYFTNEKLYNYIRRPSSIMSTSFKKADTSKDYLKINDVTYRYMKDNNFLDSYIDFFWIRFIQDYSYALDNSKKSDHEAIAARGYKFIADHQEDFNKTNDAIRGAVKGVLDRNTKQQTKDKLVKLRQSYSDWNLKHSKKYQENHDLIKFNYAVEGQAKYLEHLVQNLR